MVKLGLIVRYDLAIVILFLLVNWLFPFIIDSLKLNIICCSNTIVARRPLRKWVASTGIAEFKIIATFFKGAGIDQNMGVDI